MNMNYYLYQLAIHLLVNRDTLMAFNADIEKTRHSEILRPNTKPQLESLFDVNSNSEKWTDVTAPWEMKEECQYLLKKMETARRKVGYIDLENFCLEATSWNWKNTKNKTRDWSLLSMMAVAEKHLVTFYRQKLLTNSIAGQQLRQGISSLLTNYAKTRAKIVAGTSGEMESRNVTEYRFADGIKLKQMTSTAGQKKFDITKLVQKQVDSKRKAEAEKQVQVIVNKIERLPFAKANLDPKSLVAFGVSLDLTELIKVSSFTTRL
jgi:hypothetical protein